MLTFSRDPYKIHFDSKAIENEWFLSRQPSMRNISIDVPLAIVSYIVCISPAFVHEREHVLHGIVLAKLACLMLKSFNIKQ